MASNDYAIVVGINDYPGMEDTGGHPHNLQGPMNDAAAIHAWLTDPAKGGVPPANAALILSPRPLPDDFSTDNAEPATRKIVLAFKKLKRLLKDNQAPPVGRRLYVYMSGHGFAPDRAKGAVYTADATDDEIEHVYATAWVEWFYRAGYFEELVLWLDCCMTYHWSIVPTQPNFAVVNNPTPKLKQFMAYSARFQQQSIEASMPDHQVHGAFTYALLQALESAVDPDCNGDITTASIKRYLIHSMGKYVPDEYKAQPDVATEPDFGPDDHMVFVKGDSLKGVSVPSKEIALSGIPDGTNVEILGGNPSAQVATAVVRQGKITVSLRAGIYIARAGDQLFPFEV